MSERDAWLAGDPPSDPLPHLAAWIDEAHRTPGIAEPDAATLATVEPDGRPSARVVLVRALDVTQGSAVFYTDRSSCKGRALAAHPFAALVLYWDALARQARIAGPVTLAADAESDAYFAARHPDSRIAAAASDQSEADRVARGAGRALRRRPASLRQRRVGPAPARLGRLPALDRAHRAVGVAAGTAPRPGRVAPRSDSGGRRLSREPVARATADAVAAEFGSGMKMHEGEVQIDEELVGRLVAAQFPRLADLSIRAVSSTGTVNGYPFPWAIYRWIDGLPYADDLVDHEAQAAADLAQFVVELRGVDPVGAPRGGRRPLRVLDAVTRAAIESSRNVIDGDAVAGAWESALDAPVWDGAPQWIHSDLLRPNLLVDGGRLCAVIDFGGVGVGDPAADVVAAWSVFGRTGRARYRAVLDVEDATWHRARGYALHQAVLIIPYYSETNPSFAALAKRTVDEVLADIEA